MKKCWSGRKSDKENVMGIIEASGPWVSDFIKRVHGSCIHQNMHGMICVDNMVIMVFSIR